MFAQLQQCPGNSLVMKQGSPSRLGRAGKISRCGNSLWGRSLSAYLLGFYFKEELLVSVPITQDIGNETNQKEKTEKLFQAGRS